MAICCEIVRRVSELLLRVVFAPLAWQSPAGWWALRLILGAYSLLSIAAMSPVSLSG